MQAAVKRFRGAVGALSLEERLISLNVVIMFVPIFVSALSTFALTIWMLTKKENRERVASIPFGFYLVIWAALSLLAGLVHLNFLGDAAFLVYLSFILFSFYTFRVMTQGLARRVLRLTAALGIAAALVALAQRLIYPGMQSMSTFFNANYYGFVCEVLILAALYALLSGKEHRLLYIAAIIANIAGLYLSGCRSAWLAMLVGALVILLCRRQFRVLLGVLAAGAAAVVAVVLDPRLIPRVSSFGATKSLRFEIWQTAWHGFLRHPLIGYGFMGYWKLSAGLGRADQPHAHDVLLNALVSYGAVGVLLLIIFIVPAVIACVKRLKREPLCGLALGLITAMLVHGVTDDPILGMQTGILAMTLLALTGAKERGNLSAQEVKKIS